MQEIWSTNQVNERVKWRSCEIILCLPLASSVDYKTEYSILKSYRNHEKFVTSYWSFLWVGNLIADKGDPDGRIRIPMVSVVWTKRQSLWVLCISQMWGVFQRKFESIRNWYNIKTIFKTKHTLRSSLMKTRPERDPQQTAQCIYSIPCEWAEATLAKQPDL
jgi:hypothetical protein